jgi:hypothetical protein
MDDLGEALPARVKREGAQQAQHRPEDAPKAPGQDRGIVTAA